FQDFRKDADVAQVGASILHVPSGLWVYGLYQHEENNGTDVRVVNNGVHGFNRFGGGAHGTDGWFIKAGGKRACAPIQATVLWGEGGQYQDQFSGVAGVDLCQGGPSGFPAATTPFGNGGICFNNASAFLTSSTVNRWGAGVMQEIDSAAMHIWFNWQHLELDGNFVANPFTDTSNFRRANQSFEDLDMFMAGGVIFF